MKLKITKETLCKYFDIDIDAGTFSWLPTISVKGVKHTNSVGTYDKDGYHVICIKGKQYKAHRPIWLYAYGELPKHNIDHINGNKADNRICNLRDCTPSENMMNYSIRSDNTSGTKGVHYHKRLGKYWAYGDIKNKRTTIGYFLEYEDAVKARKKFEIENFGEFSYDISQKMV